MATVEKLSTEQAESSNREIAKLVIAKLTKRAAFHEYEKKDIGKLKEKAAKYELVTFFLPEETRDIIEAKLELTTGKGKEDWYSRLF